VDENRTLFGESDTIDSGLLRWYTDAMVDFAVNSTEYFAGWPSKIEGTIPPVPSDLVAYQLREPHGVLGLIVPWNGPSAVLAFVAAAISAGNCVVLKPAEQTPMTAILMAELAAEAGIPNGVFNVVQGAREAGEALVDHPGVDAISFTGSRTAGAAIQAAAAKRVKPVTLELGGKSPFIIFPDADLESATAAAMMGVWMASGQVCTAGTRVLIHDDIHDELVERIVAQSRDMRIGSGFDPESQLGPLVSADQLARVQSYVAIGQQEGAQLALGGHRHGETGYFHEPTIFTGVRNDMRIAQEEIFGPVMSILRFGSEAEAYAIANDTEYGLGAGVWTNDLSLAHRAARALRTGQVWINTYQAGYPTVAYGGVKQSGHGRMQGRPTIDELTHVKSVWMKVGAPL
jgi:acyl-CoA reductase-like NAD-dependent aldehyde dehydrogenase